jgi:hypothetical protein
MLVFCVEKATWTKLAGKHQHFWRTYCLYRQGWILHLLFFWIVTPCFGSSFNDAFSVTILYIFDGRVTGEWWWIDEGKHSYPKRDSNTRSQRPSNQGLRLRPRGHWDGRNAMYIKRLIRTFRRNILSTTSGWSWRRYVPPKRWYLPTNRMVL